MDYFRYHPDEMGEQKETEWGCHDYYGGFLNFLVFVLPFKNSFISAFFSMDFTLLIFKLIVIKLNLQVVLEIAKDAKRSVFS